MIENNASSTPKKSTILPSVLMAGLGFYFLFSGYRYWTNGSSSCYEHGRYGFLCGLFKMAVPESFRPAVGGICVILAGSFFIYASMKLFCSPEQFVEDPASSEDDDSDIIADPKIKARVEAMMKANKEDDGKAPKKEDAFFK